VEKIAGSPHLPNRIRLLVGGDGQVPMTKHDGVVTRTRLFILERPVVAMKTRSSHTTSRGAVNESIFTFLLHQIRFDRSNVFALHVTKIPCCSKFRFLFYYSHMASVHGGIYHYEWTSRMEKGVSNWDWRTHVL
jgi:hypothetical protein